MACSPYITLEALVIRFALLKSKRSEKHEECQWQVRAPPIEILRPKSVQAGGGGAVPNSFIHEQVNARWACPLSWEGLIWRFKVRHSCVGLMRTGVRLRCELRPKCKCILVFGGSRGSSEQSKRSSRQSGTQGRSVVFLPPALSRDGTATAGNKCVLSHSSKRLLRLTTGFEIQTARGMRLEAVSPSMLAQRPDSEPTTHSNLLSHARANSRALGGVEIGPQLAENA